MGHLKLQAIISESMRQKNIFRQKLCDIEDDKRCRIIGLTLSRDIVKVTLNETRYFSLNILEVL